MDLRSHMEGLVRVDGIRRAKTVVVRVAVCQEVKSAIATSITVVEDTVLRCVTLVARDVEGMLIGLHNVELRAPMATDLIGVTILEWVTCVVKSRHCDSVEGSKTVAVDSAQVNIKLEDTAEKVHSQESRGITDIFS